MNKNAFTMIELIFVILILGVLMAVAIPRMVSIRDDAQASTEKGIIGAVRGGIHNAHATCLSRNLGTKTTDYGTGNPTSFTASCWPDDLDTPTESQAGASGAEIFSRILKEPIENWSEVGAGEYEGPATGSTGIDPAVDSEVNKNRKWRYSTADGSVSIVDDSSTP